MVGNQIIVDAATTKGWDLETRIHDASSYNANSSHKDDISVTRFLVACSVVHEPARLVAEARV